jgi:hypothetical protein
MFDIASLADIQNGPFPILEKVDPGMGWEMIEFLFQRVHFI